MKTSVCFAERRINAPRVNNPTSQIRLTTQSFFARSGWAAGPPSSCAPSGARGGGPSGRPLRAWLVIGPFKIPAAQRRELMHFLWVDSRFVGPDRELQRAGRGRSEERRVGK